MPEKPLDYAELEAAVGVLMNRLFMVPETRHQERALILAAFQGIAKRAFEQAARLDRWHRRKGPLLVIGDPEVLLSVALAALDEPKDSVQRSVTLDNADERHTGHD